MSGNQAARPSRWGAQPPAPVAPAGGGVGGAEERRERAQSWTDPRRRGYEDAPAGGGNFERGGRDEFGRDGPRSDRWGDRREGRDGRGRPPSYDSQRYLYDNGRQQGRGDDWRCKECGLSNHPRDECCPRCQTWRREGHQGDRREGDRGRDDVDGHYSPPGARKGREEDDFGRRPRKKEPRERQWPPQFEASGSSFIFDARSGMFYEPSSDFFYDPKTKLYYSNKKRQYFQYVEEKRPYVFQPVGESGSAGQQGGGPGMGGIPPPKVITAAEEAAVEVAPEANATGANQEKVEMKPTIAISLKTPVPQKDGGAKSLNEVASLEKAKLEQAKIQEIIMKRKNSAMSTGDSTNTPGVHKKHAKDMDKWSERVKEMRDRNPAEAPPPSTRVKTTASGQPICVLCRRKFANLEKLEQHERLSAMHKENLAKKVAADAAAKEAAAKRQPSDTLYRDRSKERRVMYGSHTNQESSSHAEALMAHNLGPSSEGKPSETVRPEETLNDANVGNKLLQKMGWKSGDALGREPAAAGNSGAESKKGDAASSLKSDWERIESLAQRGGRR